MSLGGRGHKRKDGVTLRVRHGIARTRTGWQAIVEIGGRIHTLGDECATEAEAEERGAAGAAAWRHAVTATDDVHIVRENGAGLQQSNARWS